MSSINKFKPELIKAFEKMILGINVELSEKGKEYLKNTIKGRWVFITAITCDEEITIQDQTHSICSGLSLSDIKL